MDRIAPFSFVSACWPVRWKADWNAPLVLVGLLVVLLSPWVMYEGLIRPLNHDIFWLLTGLERILAGQGMIDAVYETNPPLSFFIYLPTYLLSLIGVPAEIGLLITVAMAVLLSAFAVYRLLSRHLDVDRVFACGLCGVYVIAATALIVPEFGQRDHILALGLVPLLLAQVVLLRAAPSFRAGFFLWAVCFAAAFLVLLKPHYGIVPTIMIVTRMVRGRGFRVLRDPDVIALGVMVALYAGILVVFFRDYLTQILPVVVDLYDSFGNKASVGLLFGFVVFNLLAWTASQNVVQKNIQNLIAYFSLGSVLALIPYVLMQKGFAYHLVPSSIFLFMAMGVLIQAGLRTHARPGIAMGVTIVIAASAAMLLPHSYYPTKDDVMMAPLTRALSYEPDTMQKCNGECRFMVLGLSLRATQLSSHYAGGEQASRFGTLWFIPGLIEEAASLQTSPDAKEQEEYLKMKTDFIAMLRQDVATWRPDRILFCNTMQDLAYFNGDTILKASPYEYRFVKTLSVNRSEYFSATDKKMTQCKLYDRIAP